MTEHTPLPWHTGSTEHTELVMGFKDNIECVLAELDTDDVSMEETAGNADYIVKACNAFPDLVKALEEIAAIENREFGADWEEIEEARHIARGVLSRVGSVSTPEVKP